MALRSVADFDAKQWKQLQEMMKRGQTEKQAQVLKEAHERLKNIKVDF